MRGRTVLLYALGAVGLWLYLWPALQGPAVVWADGRVDMHWAREGTGLWRPLSAEEASHISVHPLKPGYLLYLRLAMSAIPGVPPERSAILVQSLLLWFSIAATSVALGRRRGFLTGASAYVLILLFIPLRDIASAVMTEAVSAALFLPIAATAIEPPRTRGGILWTALGICVLFSIRPNVGTAALLLVLAGWLVSNSFRQTLAVAALFLAGAFAIWALTRPSSGPDPSRGLHDALLFGSSEYNWGPSLGPWPAVASNQKGVTFDPRLRQAAENWRRTLAQPAADRDRELLWRAWHGLFGLEYYDGRWSATYRCLDHALRASAGFLLTAALGCALALRRGLEHRAANIVGLLLVPAFVLHNLAFAPIPRYLLPFLPFLFLLAARAVCRGRSVGFFVRAAALCLAQIAFLARYPEIASWDWGQIESAGVTIEQRLPRGSLPRPGQVATLHVRMASPIPGGGAHFAVSADELSVYRSTEDPDRSRAYITAVLPAELLRRNAVSPITLRVRSFGSYGPDSFLLFAIRPPPWGTGAQRAVKDALSPGSDVHAGGLDWWAHSGDR